MFVKSDLVEKIQLTRNVTSRGENPTSRGRNNCDLYKVEFPSLCVENEGLYQPQKSSE